MSYLNKKRFTLRKNILRAGKKNFRRFCDSGLEFWRHEPSVLIYACLAVGSFAKRAQMEAARILARSPQPSPQPSPVRLTTRKILDSHEGGLKTAGLLHHLEISDKPVTWLPQDGSDVDSVVRIMKMHNKHRKLIGAASSALSSLVRCSNLHAQAILKQV